MARTKGSKNRPKIDANKAPGSTLTPSDEVQVKAKPKRAQKAVKRSNIPIDATQQEAAPEAAPEARQLVVVDLVSGETLGPAKTLDLSRSGRKYYSHSFIKSVAQCTAKAHFRTLKVEVPKVFALERGSCLHKLFEDFGKLGKDPMESFDTQWRLFITDNLPNMSPEDQEKAAKGYEESKLMVEEFLLENRELFSSVVKPEDNEVEFTIPITMKIGDKEFTRDFYGKIDLLVWNKDRTAARLLDYKTSSSAPSKDELAIDTQFALYETAFYHLFPGKRLSGLDYYLLKGQHGCTERFSSKAHPRDPLNRKPGCWINYAIKVPKKSPEYMQALFNTYYAPNILKWEMGLISKEGLSDPRNRCGMCEYKKHCDTVTELPAPIIL